MGREGELYVLEKGKHLAAELKVPVPESQQCLLSPRGPHCSSWPLAQLYLRGQPSAADRKG